MTAKSEPTIWKILPTNGGQFQWAIAGGDPIYWSDRSSATLVPDAVGMPVSRLPSMENLLLQSERIIYLPNGRADPATTQKLKGVRGENSGGGAMFSTGSGRLISAQQSSIQKARRLLEGENVDDEGSYGSECFPMFRTGLGKSVQVRQSSINKAAAFLEVPHEKEGNCDGECFPMFRTGLDKSVKVRQSSIEKAAALLELTHEKEGNPACKDALLDHKVRDAGSTCPPLMFHTAGGRAIPISSDSLNRAKNLLNDSRLEAAVRNMGSTHPPLKFHTAGGRSISISSDSLHRAKSLLNDLDSEAFEDEAKMNASTYSCNVERVSFDGLPEGSTANDSLWKVSSSGKQLCSNRNVDLPIEHRKGMSSRMGRRGSSAGEALADISNFTGSFNAKMSWFNGEKKRAGKASLSSSFKKPRTSSSNLASAGLMEAGLPSTSENYSCKSRFSLRYPFRIQRKKMKEYFGVPPNRFIMLENIPNRVKYMTADNAENYRFGDACSSIDFGPKAFREMLAQCGASLTDASEKWVRNHYKWIVWKLTCLERCYSYKFTNKLLTASNVLEELKYRYEREVNYGHKSALKKILDGDGPPSSTMILCVSAIRPCSNSRTDEDEKPIIGFGSTDSAKIELTDGWYSLDATLDAHLSKHLLAGKLFVGQKLRVCGATLCGWVEPISPLEVSNTINLALHINGTYRAHWADPLGFCEGIGAPLAFRCIKGGGGKVPKTLVGIARLYPILYKERLLDGGSVVRSESMESRMVQLYNQRRTNIAEDIIYNLEEAPFNSNDNEEGAKLLKLLESSAEPEILMAGMTSEQLSSFSSYQAKQDALRQANLHKKMEKALEDAGLGSRDVTPFMRVRVNGLTSVDSSRKGRPSEGLITIWNPTEKQKLDLVEGQIYSVSWLVPFRSTSDFLYLQCRGPSSEWIRLPSTDSTKFESFFIPRKSVSLSNLGEIPLASEFDIAAMVVYVGEAYTSGCRRKQWIFVADESGCIGEDEHDGLMAISFCSSILGNDSLAPVDRCLSGNVAGFCNLIKRARDLNNHLWVAEATENSTYSFSYNLSSCSHLKKPADSALKWTKTHFLALKRLEERVLRITGGHGI